MAKRKVKFITVRFFGYERDYTYKTTILDIENKDFVIVPTQRGNTVARVEKSRVPRPEYVCKMVVSKIEL